MFGKIYLVQCRGAQILGARSPRRTLGATASDVPGPAPNYPSGSQNFTVAVRFQKNFCTPGPKPVAYQGIFFGGGGGQQIQFRTEDRKNGDLGALAP
jgi:hypothetical protein